MTLKIYLMRHGETNFNKRKNGWKQDDQERLNELGINQAKKLFERLKGIEFDKIFSSELNRVVETTKELIKLGNGKIIFDERLKEYNPGEVDQSSDKWMQKYKELSKKGISKYDIRPFGGENIWDLIKRVNSFLEDIEKEKGTIAIVSSSGVNSAFINLSQRREKDNFLKIKQDNTCINMLEFDGKKWHIQLINDSEHLNNLIPKKNVYPNKKEILRNVQENLLIMLKYIADEIYLSGDLIHGNFGVFERPYKRYNGSTIEVYAKIKEGFVIPEEWKISILTTKTKKYEIGNIKINGIKHKINITLILDKKEIVGKFINI